MTREFNELPEQGMAKFHYNYWNTTPLVLNVMRRVANVLTLDLYDDTVTSTLYDICCDLEDDDDIEEFGSSDAYSYIQQARNEFGLDEA